MVTETIGQRIRRLRMAKGIRFQKDLAKMIEIDPASLNQIEQGYRVPKLSTVDKMATALGVTRDLILDGEPAARAMPPRPSESAPVAASEQPPLTRSRHADTDPLDPDLYTLIRSSVQAEIRDELRNFAVDIATSIAASLTRRPATAPRQGARPRAHRV